MEARRIRLLGGLAFLSRHDRKSVLLQALRPLTDTLQHWLRAGVAGRWFAPDPAKQRQKPRWRRNGAAAGKVRATESSFSARYLFHFENSCSADRMWMLHAFRRGIIIRCQPKTERMMEYCWLFMSSFRCHHHCAAAGVGKSNRGYRVFDPSKWRGTTVSGVMRVADCLSCAAALKAVIQPYVGARFAGGTCGGEVANCAHASSSPKNAIKTGEKRRGTAASICIVSSSIF